MKDIIHAVKSGEEKDGYKNYAGRFTVLCKECTAYRGKDHK